MSEKMRESFELFCDSVGYHYTRDGDDYLGSYGKTMWMAWKASRAALVVELPDSWILGENGDDIDAIATIEVKSALDVAGVSYKLPLHKP